MRTPIARITLIDDDEDDVLILSQLLERCGFPGSPRCFADANVAITHLRETADEAVVLNSAQLVFVAVRSGGYDVLRRLRGDERLRASIVILLSGADEPRNIGKALQLQADGFLVKFPSLYEMREVLEETKKMALLPHPRPVLQLPCNLLQAAVVV